jgi:hypothetical protein
MASASIDFTYRPLSVYRSFHASSVKEGLLVGGLGSGKTIALCADAIATGLRVPGLLIGMMRKTVPELRDTLEVEFLNVMPHDLYLASTVRRSGGHIESITFPNGTKYIFRSVDDWVKLKSVNFGRIYIDELSEFDVTTYRGILSRIRQRYPLGDAKQLGHTEELPEWVRGLRAASNSNGKDWMWKRFVKEADPQLQKAWVATTLDNPHLPEDYLESLFSMPEQWVKRFVLCSFDDFGGLIYPMWDYDRHVVKEQVALQRTTPIWMGYDPGTRHPTAMLWAAVLDRTLVGIHEELASDTDVESWVARVREVEKAMPPIRWRVGDPNSMHVRDRGTMMSVHQQWVRHGIVFQNGPSRHADRIPMLGALLNQDRFKLSRACPQTAEQIEGYRWEDLTTATRTRLGEHAEAYAPEKPVQAFDDLVDCAQYLSSRWVRPMQGASPKRVKPQTPWQEQSDELRATMARMRGRPRRTAPGQVV